MHKIPIFDSLTHPTSCGDWLNGKDYNNVVNNLLNQMKENKIKCDIAIGKGKKTYDQREDVKQRDWNREKQRILKNSNR